MTDIETNISDSSDDNMNTNTIHTSYEESSSMDKYFKENCSNDCTFPPIHQRNAIKKVITMACTKKRAVMTFSQTIMDNSFIIFFGIAQIAFLANDMILKYLSIILSLVIPLWRTVYKCQLDIPTTPDQIKSIITSTAQFSIRSLIPMPTLEVVKDHCYFSLPSLLAYTSMTSTNTYQAGKPRYIAWMKSKSCITFCDKVKTLSVGSRKPSIAVFMVFWSDGFDPTTSMKRNRHSVWILTVTFFFFDISKQELYLVESCLVAIGPGKGAAESKEDHSCIFDKLRSDLDNINNKDDGSPIPLSFIS